MTRSPDIIICGAGIAGVSAAYHLAVRHGIGNIWLVDDRPPLTLTSDKSTECYRNWWPGPGDTMVRFMNRSIDLLEELAEISGNYFHLSRRGYVFLTAREKEAARLRETAVSITNLGAGELRVHDGRTPHTYSHDSQDGADLITDPALIRQTYPFVTTDAVAMLHARRCGWLSAQQLGMYLLQEAKQAGVRQVNGKVVKVDVANGRIHTVHIQTEAGMTAVQTRTFVNAAGPLQKQVAAFIGVDLPVFNELHGKVAIEDYLNVVPRDVPLMIWNDPVELPWTDEEREELAADAELAWLTRPFPAGVHFRPEGHGDAQTLLMLWTYHVEAMEPVWPPPPFEPEYPEIVVRGLSRMIPGLSVYFDRMSQPQVDGGYYCKTQENRPLIGPLPVEGAYLIGALSGYGIMSSQAAADLLAAHITGGALPGYAPDFRLSRYDDPAYQDLLKQWDAGSGQL
ncbi:MAG: NAD(P)/FAD-dependent oxidoreductase [Anaerolineae bacterium]